MGTLTKQSEGQWSVIGGTGEFTKAHGTIKYKMDPASNIEDGIRELDIHLIYTPNYPQAVSTSEASCVNISLIYNYYASLTKILSFIARNLTKGCSRTLLG